VIAGLRGTLERCLGDQVLVATPGGVVYDVTVTRRAREACGEVGTTVSLVTYLHLREDGAALYGFADDSELQIFHRLIAVSTVGPRLAVTVLSALEPSQLLVAVEGEDVSLLGRIPGIGKQKASRIVLELKGKLPSLGATASGGPARRQMAPVQEALAAWGFTPAEIQQALAGLPSDTPVTTREEIAAALELSLQHLRR
jgi:Holliday junction DNA helicase RuvA